MEAQSLLWAHPDVKLVLMDVLMAELEGLELLRRGREYTPSTMWIILSAVDTFDFRQQGRSRTLAVRRRHLLAPA